MTESSSLRPASDIAEHLEFLVNEGGGHDLAPDLGADILDLIEAHNSRFLVYPDEWCRHAHTLWCAHCWLMSCWYFTPRLLLLSPTPNCGKGTAFRLTKMLVPVPKAVALPTKAALYRMIDQSMIKHRVRPTILFDEIDAIFGPKAGRGNPQMASLIQVGFDRSMTVPRQIGKDVIDFSPFAAMAMTGRMTAFEVPEAIRSRSVIIQMQRKAEDDVSVEDLDVGRDAARAAVPLRDLMRQWAEVVGNEAERHVPEKVKGVANRDADMWRALRTVADLAGGDHWPEFGRVTAVTLVTAAELLSGPNQQLQVLWACNEVFTQRREETLFTENLLAELRILDSCWSGLTPRTLAGLLGSFGVHPKLIRKGGPPARGYERADFIPRWKSYPLPADVTSVTPVTSAPSHDRL